MQIFINKPKPLEYINTVNHGDCLEIMPKLPSGVFDMLLCDLPYGTTQNKWDSVIDLRLLWKEYNRLIKENGVVALTAQIPFSITLGESNKENLRYEWIWKKTQKTGFLNANKMPLKNHENILIFYKKLPVYNPEFTEGTPYTQEQGSGSSNYNYNEFDGGQTTVNDGYRYPVTIIEFKSEKSKLHPTQKPVALFEYLINTYTNPGDLVLDNCAGSGTTGVAAINTGRNFTLIEKDEGYFKKIVERLNSL